MSVMVSIKYFDEQNGWGMRRPTNIGTHSARTFSFCTVNFGQSDMTDAERCVALAETLGQQQPAFVAVQEVSQSLCMQLLLQPAVRKYYAVTDLVKHNCSVLPQSPKQHSQAEHGCVFLIRHVIHVDFAESISRQIDWKGQARPLLVLHMRQFSGVSCTIAVTHLDPGASTEQRLTLISSVVQKLDNTEIVLLASNCYDGPGEDPAMRREVNSLREQLGMSDANETCTEPSQYILGGPVSVWIRTGGRANPSVASPLLVNDKGMFRHASVVQFLLRGNANSSGGASSNTGIMIPQPRSAKTAPAAASKSPVTGGGGGVFTDPAIVSVTDEKSVSTPVAKGAQDGINVASLFPIIKKRGDRWRHDNAFHLNSKSRNLSVDESAYDLSNHFSSVKEACEGLNGGTLQWAADFFVVNGTIIGSDAVQTCDLKAFRKYVQSRPNPWTLTHGSPQTPGSPLAPAAASSADHGKGPTARKGLSPVDEGAASDDSPKGSGLPFSNTAPMATRLINHHRPRIWSESFSTILFQVTPREMKFDITTHIGLTRNSLKTAISRLNTRKTMAATLAENTGRDKPDPLTDWPHDYAILYSTERQAYMLIACADVPCDIIACRIASSA
jgi:hypothetical protein